MNTLMLHGFCWGIADSLFSVCRFKGYLTPESKDTAL
jgi:hypothetical protein